MSNLYSEDDNLNFQCEVNFNGQQEEKKTMIPNDNNFKILSEICDSFYDNLQKNDYFGHKSAWRTFSDIEPIKLKIESVEALPGICDIINPDNNNFYHKVLTAFGSIILKIDNLLPNIGQQIMNLYSGYQFMGKKLILGKKKN